MKPLQYIGLVLSSCPVRLRSVAIPSTGPPGCLYPAHDVATKLPRAFQAPANHVPQQRADVFPLTASRQARDSHQFHIWTLWASRRSGNSSLLPPKCFGDNNRPLRTAHSQCSLAGYFVVKRPAHDALQNLQEPDAEDSTRV